MKKVVLMAISLAMLMIIQACSSGSSDDSSSRDSSSESKVGYFIDSRVQGVEYSSDKGDSGLTDVNGQFTYLTGSTITFTIGGITLGRITDVNKDQFVFIQDLFKVDRKETYNESVLRIARILQSLDEDGDPSNGIKIIESTRSRIKDAVDSGVDLGLLTDKELEDNFKSITGKELISASDAKIHLDTVYNDFKDLVDSENAICANGTSTPFGDYQVDSLCETACFALEQGRGSNALEVCDTLQGYATLTYTDCGACGSGVDYTDYSTPIATVGWWFDYSFGAIIYEDRTNYRAIVESEEGELHLTINAESANGETTLWVWRNIGIGDLQIGETITITETKTNSGDLKITCGENGVAVGSWTETGDNNGDMSFEVRRESDGYYFDFKIIMQPGSYTQGDNKTLEGKGFIANNFIDFY